jgi:class 3 adenylate cyclase
MSDHLSIQAEAGRPPLPETVWDGLDYTYIHTAVLFADLENSVLLSSTVDPREYQVTINACQRAMLDLVAGLQQQGYRIGEFSVAGDQLALFLYDPDEVRRNYLLDGPQALQGAERAALVTECRRRNEELAYQGLAAAVSLKNSWLAQDFNLERVRSRREPLGLGMGVHYGRVYLCNRADGRRRIEGYTVNYAKRVEGYSRQGRYSRIMFSREARDTIRFSQRRHTLLRQRVFFQRHDVGLEMLKGITRGQSTYELKFYSRIGLAITAEIAGQYEVLFAIDPENVWAYYQLFEYYAYQLGDWDRVYHLARRAHAAYQKDEKILLDFSRYHYYRDSLDQSEEFARQALQINADFDLAWEQLSLIAARRGDVEGQLRCLTHALTLAPGSPVHHLNLGYSLCEAGRFEEGSRNLQLAFELYPPYLETAETRQNLLDLARRDLLPGKLAAELGLELSA